MIETAQKRLGAIRKNDAAMSENLREPHSGASHVYRIPKESSGKPHRPGAHTGSISPAELQAVLLLIQSELGRLASG